MENYADILFIDDVRELQDEEGTGEKFASFYGGRTKNALDQSDRQFLSERESFYIASVSSTGWPYVQHRGGPKGFLKIIDDVTLGFIDYPGNRQFITMGHSTHDNRVALFFMDYERRTRLKMLGKLSMKPAKDVDPKTIETLSTEGQARVDRVAIIDVIAMDWNCPKYIPAMYSKQSVHSIVDSQVNALTDENEKLKAQLEKLQNQ